MTSTSTKVQYCFWNSNPHQAELFLENRTLYAFMKDSNEKEPLFETYQIKFGPIKSQPLADLIERTTQFYSECFSTFIHPKKDPKDLWIAKANEATLIDIKAEEKHLDKEKNYEKAIKCFQKTYKKLLPPLSLQKANTAYKLRLRSIKELFGINLVASSSVLHSSIRGRQYQVTIRNMGKNSTDCIKKILN